MKKKKNVVKTALKDFKQIFKGYYHHNTNNSISFKMRMSKAETPSSGWNSTSKVTSYSFYISNSIKGARCSSVVRAFAHGAMGHRIDPSW